MYANSQTNGGTFPEIPITHIPTGSFIITNPANAVASGSTGQTKPVNAGTRLSVSSTAGVATAWLQMAFPSDVAANKTVYVKVGTGAIALLGGGISLQVYATATGTGSTVNLENSTPVTYYTADGNAYMAIKPTGAFRSVRILLTSPLALGTNNLDVFYVFYGPNQSNDTNPFPFNIADCGLPNVTATAFSGLTLGSVTIANPGNAIDTDVITGSAYNTAGVSVSGHIIQTFYFNGNSNSGDAVRVIFSKGSALVNIDVGKAVKIQGYNGSNAVGISRPLSSLLDVDLLGLLTSGSTAVTSYFAPKDISNSSVVFDRVTLDFDLGLLGVSLNGNGLNVFDVRRVPDAPTASDVMACTNVGTINLAATTVQSNIANIGDFTYTWYNAVRQGTLLGALVGQIPFLATDLTTVAKKEYYVDITKSGCTVPSGRTRVTVNTINPPIVPPIALVP
ncbi:hypothetical protein [Dyadobacter sp. 3J3]|uniref:hypothetical protein n=1 Tax=Dyadobacter sp. 3J3 TaxID=2606600 RepID=UPI00135934EB|nr:hypothetical protein [Dyadobacter sp. 3J3]